MTSILSIRGIVKTSVRLRDCSSTQEIHERGLRFHCVTLERLIQLKRAAGRPKNLEAIAELQAILDGRQRL